MYAAADIDAAADTNAVAGINVAADVNVVGKTSTPLTTRHKKRTLAGGLRRPHYATNATSLN